MLSIHFFSNYSQKRFNLILRKTFGNEVENLDRINFFILIYLFMDFFSSLGTELVQHKPRAHKNRLRNFSKRISNADVEFEKEEPWDFFPPLFPRNKFAFRACKRLNVFALARLTTHPERRLCACHPHLRVIYTADRAVSTQSVLTQFPATDREGLKASDWPARRRLEPTTRPDWPSATPLRSDPADSTGRHITSDCRTAGHVIKFIAIF